MRSRQSVLALLFSTLFTACSTYEGASDVTPLDECPDLDYSTCDTRKVACQAQLLELASCIYGVTPRPRVPVRLLTEAQLADELSSDAIGFGAGDDASLPHVERALVDLKLLLPGDLTETGAAMNLARRMDGIYLDAPRGIVLVDRGVAPDSAEQDALLVREWTHALQDAAYDVPVWRERFGSGLDTELALRAVTDGQATHVQYRAWAAISGSDVNLIDWYGTFAKLRRSSVERALADDSPYFASRARFPSGFGAALASLRWQQEGRLYHATQFDEPPQTSLAVLAQSLEREVSDAAPPFREPTATDQSRLVTQSELGAFVLELFAARIGDDLADPFALQFSWGGDELWIFAGENDETDWLWEIQVEDDAAAERIASLAQGAHYQVESNRNRVFLVRSDAAPAFLLDAGRAFLTADAGP